MTKVELLQNAKPILFNTDMVRAITDGIKTETRRVIKPHNRRKAREQGYCLHDGFWIDRDDASGEGYIKDYSVSPCWFSWSAYTHKYAPYHPGDTLYVRETWAERDKFYYRADSVRDGNIIWRPSIHMPKRAARILLQVKEIGIQRLQNITAAHILAEGIRQSEINHYIEQIAESTQERIEIAHKRAFESLWDSTVKAKDKGCYGWDANPWVWVIKFERIMEG